MYYVTENSVVGSVIGTVKATDKDIHSRVGYAIQGRSPFFKVNSVSGEITSSRTIDFEKDPKSFGLTIIACDNGHRCDNTKVSITIIDLNDNSPEIIWPENDREIVQVLRNESEIHSLLTTVVTQDKDSGDLGTVICSLQGKSKLFYISEDCKVSLIEENDWHV